MTDSGPIAVRAQALALLECSIPVKTIMEITGLCKSTIFRIRQIAKDRGYNPEVSTAFRNAYFVDAPRSGRPKTVTTPETTQKLIEHISANRPSHELSTIELAHEFNMSHTTTWRILRNAGYGKRKPTMKPGLTESMKAARLDFAIKNEHWKLEDWKNVIWTDETSIVLGHRRGGTRVWRKLTERYAPSVIRARFKRASKFMF